MNYHAFRPYIFLLLAIFNLITRVCILTISRRGLDIYILIDSILDILLPLVVKSLNKLQRYTSTVKILLSGLLQCALILPIVISIINFTKNIIYLHDVNAVILIVGFSLFVALLKISVVLADLWLNTVDNCDILISDQFYDIITLIAYCIQTALTLKFSDKINHIIDSATCSIISIIFTPLLQISLHRTNANTDPTLPVVEVGVEPSQRY